MRRNTLTLLILLTVSMSPTHAGWFSGNTEKKSPEVTEQIQRIQTEERLKAAQQQISTQEQQLNRQETTISKLRWMNTLAIAGAVILMIVGVAMGSTVRAMRDGNPS